MCLTAERFLSRSLVLTLALIMIALPVFAREEAVAPGATLKAPASDTSAEPQREASKPHKSESAAKPPSGTRPNPEQANPALLNPCHGTPQPKWCGE